MIVSPDDSSFDELCQKLSDLARSRNEAEWPAESLRLCAQYGVFRWFISSEFGGAGWNPKQITKGYLKLSSACLTTAFVITQRTAATQRIQSSSNHELQDQWLSQFASGDASTTVGISHLTTSRQHTEPAMSAEPVDGGYFVEGFSPWVTGGAHADQILMGATLPDRTQILFLISQDNVEADEPFDLMGLTGSRTGSVRVKKQFVPNSLIVSGPAEQVVKSAKGGMTGGLQTSTLAIGLGAAATHYLVEQAQVREDLRESSHEFQSQMAELHSQLLELAHGNQVCSTQELRTRANSFVVRAAQAALVAAKGSGYVAGHPVGRWCRESLFFLVWSCPQPVLSANLCELAGLEIG